MYRVYVGNLNPDIDEGTLRGLFEEKGIVAGNILVKRSYAFLDCADQANVDKAIDTLNGYQLQGKAMQVEPSMSRRRRTNKVTIRNFPSNYSADDIQAICSNYGQVLKCEHVGAEDLVYVTFDSPESAQQAVQHLNNQEYNQSPLKVDFANNRTRRMRLSGSNNGGPGGMNKVELPLRILVGSEFVGAIIGRQGQTIHNITSQTRARVDVHRRDSMPTSETVITIKGSPESCTKACNEIMKIVNQESQTMNRGKGPHQDMDGYEKEYPLKILCPNNLCGRIIGKGGSVIKGFMEESGTRIAVSSANDVGNFYVDRVVTVTGPVENAAKAEGLLSEKMRKCYEQDMQQYNQMGMFGGNYGAGNMGVMPSFNYQGVRGPYQHQQYGGMQGGGGGVYPGLFGAAPPQPPQQQLEITYLYIPESTVGAVIGSKGANIKNIMRLSQARIKILPQKEEEGGEGEKVKPRMPPGHLEERKVIITGTPEAQWKAQFYISEKIQTEKGFAGTEDVHLRSEISVPKGLIGRIIGKGGQHVKEMQRVSGAIVKTPDTKNFPDHEEVPVTIIGHFYASQSAQRRIRALMTQAIQGNSGGPRGPQRQQNGI